MSTVTIKGVSKTFGTNTVLREFNEVFKDGEFVTLLGPSGCGKTTMLRIVAGFERPSTGEVYIDDQLVSGGKTFVQPEKRNIGMVFQSYAVWPHMNVFDNVAYPLTIQKIPKATMKEKVDRVLGIVHLAQYAERLYAEGCLLLGLLPVQVTPLRPSTPRFPLFGGSTRLSGDHPLFHCTVVLCLGRFCRGASACGGFTFRGRLTR